MLGVDARALTVPLWYSLTTDPAQVGGVTSTPGIGPCSPSSPASSRSRSRSRCCAPRAAGTGALSRLLLGADTEELSERVEVLTETRAGAVDAAAAELERIERDLHDGAQARLVALAMDLGMAEERFERDPDGARELVEKARDEAKQALAELRDLARGHAARAARRARAARGDPRARVAHRSCRRR